MKFDKIIHLSQMISLSGQRLNNTSLSDEQETDLIEQLLDELTELEFYVKDELYMRYETIDGQHS